MLESRIGFSACLLFATPEAVLTSGCWDGKKHTVERRKEKTTLCSHITSSLSSQGRLKKENYLFPTEEQTCDTSAKNLVQDTAYSQIYRSTGG
jgi:hypothetical protein